MATPEIQYARLMAERRLIELRDGTEAEDDAVTNRMDRPWWGMSPDGRGRVAFAFGDALDACETPEAVAEALAAAEAAEEPHAAERARHAKAAARAELDRP